MAIAGKSDYPPPRKECFFCQSTALFTFSLVQQERGKNTYCSYTEECHFPPVFYKRRTAIFVPACSEQNEEKHPSEVTHL